MFLSFCFPFLTSTPSIVAENTNMSKDFSPPFGLDPNDSSENRQGFTLNRSSPAVISWNIPDNDGVVTLIVQQLADPQGNTRHASDIASESPPFPSSNPLTLDSGGPSVKTTYTWLPSNNIPGCDSHGGKGTYQLALLEMAPRNQYTRSLSMSASALHKPAQSRL